MNSHIDNNFDRLVKSAADEMLASERTMLPERVGAALRSRRRVRLARQVTVAVLCVTCIGVFGLMLARMSRPAQAPHSATPIASDPHPAPVAPPAAPTLGYFIASGRGANAEDSLDPRTARSGSATGSPDIESPLSPLSARAMLSGL